MKKKESYQSFKLTGVKIFIDDVDYIIAQLRQICSDIKIETEDYELTDPQDLLSLRVDQLKYLMIKGHKPHFATFQLQDYDTRLAVWGDDASAIGVFSNVREFLRRRQRKLLVWLDRLDYFVVGVVGSVIGGILILPALGVQDNRDPLTYGAMAFLSSFIYFVVFKLRNPFIWRASILILKRSHETKSFFQRNRDQILVQLLVLIVGFALGYIARLVGAGP